MPFSEHDGVDHPLQFYAATKRANELMAHAYSHLFRLPTTGLRFFTVYGPWGRPDMALFLFTKSILEGEPIKVFNHGQHTRDFTYVDDIVEGVIRAIRPDRRARSRLVERHARPGDLQRAVPHLQHRQQRPGGARPTTSTRSRRRSAARPISELLPLQPGDVPDTYADVVRARAAVGYKPATPVEVGVEPLRRLVSGVLWVLTALLGRR